MLAINLDGRHKAKIIRVEDFDVMAMHVKELCDSADIIFIQRNLFGNVVGRAFQLQQAGKIIIADYDDAYDRMDAATGSMSEKFWRGYGIDDSGKEKIIEPNPLTMIRLASRMTGIVSSPSRLILQDWAEYGVKTYYIPNLIDRNNYVRKDVYKAPGRIVLGWGGSLTHVGSWKSSGAATAVTAIIKKYNNVDILIMGDPRIAKMFDVPPSRRIEIGWVSNAEYINRLSAVDIGLAPLWGEYDRRRSRLKSMEFTLLGIPWIGSDLEPNQEIQTGRLVKEGHGNWYDALHHYITNLEGVKEIAKSNMPIVKEFTIQESAGKIVEVFEQIYLENGGE